MGHEKKRDGFAGSPGRAEMRRLEEIGVRDRGAELTFMLLC